MFKEKLITREVSNQIWKDYIEQLTSINKIIIWGASDGGQRVYNFLKEVNLNYKVIGFADNDKNKWGKKF